jgi:porphobilinogen synthase
MGEFHDKPEQRLRRLRQSTGLRALVREHRLHPSELVLPLFAVTGRGVCVEVGSMPGVFRESPDMLAEHAQRAAEQGIRSVMLFGLPEGKDVEGRSALEAEGVVPQALAAIHKAVPEMVCIADLCFCEYTSHGHCGPLTAAGHVDNDATLALLGEQARVLACAGADVIAPSGMMDGMVRAIRKALDRSGHELTPILSYAAKYASAYYGPFRDAADSAPTFGDRRAYQMDPANAREALREVALDIEEGADMVMVKPALPCLDIIRAVRERHDVPLAAYQVSGEYSMIAAAGAKGWIDAQRVMRESLLAIRRAGAGIIITYAAENMSRAIHAGHFEG